MEIKCKRCGNMTECHSPTANFIVLCSVCKSDLFMQCEYGYGPVTPCQIYCGDKLIGEVYSDDGGYFLRTILTDEVILLKNTYLAALEEAENIMEKLL